MSLEAIYKYDIASKVPLHGEISFEELSRLCGLYEPDLRRILRFAMVHHRVFREHRKNMISHSTASRRLAEDAATQDAMGFMFDGAWQSYARVCLLLHSVVVRFADVLVDSRGYGKVQGP